MLRSILFFASLAAAIPRSSVRYNDDPYSAYHTHLAKRQSSNSTADNCTPNDFEIDLGYSIYRGFFDNTTQLNTWRGMRYAQPPTGELRWQQPRAPAENRTSIVDANGYGTSCPQAPQAGDTYTEVSNSDNGEDCLFINVIAPPNITAEDERIPVMVWLHPGGYGAGSGGLDFSNLMHTNADAFLTVTFNYRLGAFGFLSSDEVHFRGTPNAGIHDQQLALQWVQRYIHLFGGDKTNVTIFGESAGAGSVMLHDIAYGGTLGTKLFKNSMTSSPYLAFQYGYKDWQPSQAYYAFANAVGCDIAHAYLHNGSKAIFDCLVQADEQTLIEANVNISQSGTWGSFAFLPVTDGDLIQDLPSKALKEGKINGLNHLAGHNALEGAAWVPRIIETINDLVDYIDRVFPMFRNNDLAKLLYYYELNNASTDWDAPLWATAGDSGPTQINQSTAATGQQQRAIAMYGETTFICPSYWLAEAYSDNKFGGQGWKYQFTIPNAYHGADGAAYLRDPSDPAYYGFDATTAFQMMLGNFITKDDPRIPSLIANGITTGNETENPVSEWPHYSLYNPTLLDFNTTCPEIEEIGGLPYCVGDEAELRLRLSDAYEWEGGRGRRCDFWKMMGELVPE